MTRRKLLKTAAATAATVTMWRNTALHAQSVVGANDRINLALIGCGTRGTQVARLMAAPANNVSYVAFCDVSRDTVNRGVGNDFASQDAKPYGDFRQILDRKDIQAIHVATPDHWHCMPTVLGCQAGKDVYVEKPLAVSIWEGRQMVNAARKYNRIVQTGTQHRSAPHYKEVEDLIQSGTIGDVHFVHVCNYGGGTAGINIQDGPVPDGVDWDMYCGPTPLVPFNSQRFQGSFRRFYAYSGGFITDFGAHRLDSVHQVMHDDRPLSVYGAGALYLPVGEGDTPDVIAVTYEYKNWKMFYEGIQMNPFGTGPRIPGGRVPYSARGNYDRPHGEAFYGTKGTIFSDRVGYELFMTPTGGGRGGFGRGGGRRGGAAGGAGAGGAAAGGAPPAAAAPTTQPAEVKSVQGADRTDLHTANFIECIRTRKAPHAEVEIGHKSSIVPHLGNISYRIGTQKFNWNPDKEVSDNADANKWLKREYRKKWDLISSDT